MLLALLTEAEGNTGHSCAESQQHACETGIPQQEHGPSDPRAYWRAQETLITAWLIASTALMVGDCYTELAPGLPTAAALLSMCGALYVRQE